MKSRISASDARASLAALASSGQFTPTKPLGQYSDATVQRYAATFAKQRAAGQPVSTTAARGHARTPEHPGRPVRPIIGSGTSTPKPAPKPAPPLKGVPKVMKFPDGKVTSTYSETRAERAVKGAANRGNRVTVKVSVDGKWVEVYSNKGHSKGISATKLKQIIADAGSLEAALSDAASGSGTSNAIEGEIDAYQVDELYGDYW